jgi:hypothetical protein
VLEALLLGGQRAPVDLATSTTDLFALAIDDRANAGSVEVRGVAVFEVDDQAGVNQDGGGVGRDEGLGSGAPVLSQADEQWRGLAGDDDLAGVVVVHDAQGPSPAGSGERASYGGVQVLGVVGLSVVGGLDEVSDDLGVGIAGELGIPKVRPQLGVVLDDAVVNDDDLALLVRMGVATRRGAVRGPARVADTAASGNRVVVHSLGEGGDLALATDEMCLADVGRLDGDPGRVVAAVFEFAQALQEEFSRASFARVADDPAHGRLASF